MRKGSRGWSSRGRKLVLAGLAASFILAASGCGSSGSGSAQSVIVVTIDPPSVAVVTGGTEQFTATVAGSSSLAVTWSASAGSITSDGLFTAPATIPSANPVTITATSVADPSRSASAAITITGAGTLTLLASAVPQCAVGKLQLTVTNATLIPEGGGGGPVFSLIQQAESPTLELASLANSQTVLKSGSVFPGPTPRSASALRAPSLRSSTTRPEPPSRFQLRFPLPPSPWTSSPR